MGCTRRSLLAGVAASSLAVALGGCTSRSSSAEPVAGMFRDGNPPDIDPLLSPADAVRRATVVVRGALADIVRGIEIVSDNDEINDLGLNKINFATFCIRQARCVAGDATAVQGGRVYVNVRSGQCTATQLDRVRPEAEIVAVAYALPLEPMYQSRYRRTKALPVDAALLGGFLDGIWLQGASDPQMLGLHGSLADLAPAWRQPRTLDDYASRITSAV